MELYRGVNSGNKTLPERYYSDGLLTKQHNSGDDPEPHKKYGWLATITNHIHFTNPQERFIYDTTQFLSFSSNRDIALSFIGGATNRRFEPAMRSNAEAFLFTANFADGQLEKVGKGVYTFSYSCNYGRCTSDAAFVSPIGGLVRCNICNHLKGYLHKAVLINAEQFLFDLQSDYPEEYQKALWDKEWLIMPADPMVDLSGKGFQSRLFIADFWSVEFFKYLN